MRLPAGFDWYLRLLSLPCASPSFARPLRGGSFISIIVNDITKVRVNSICVHVLLVAPFIAISLSRPRVLIDPSIARIIFSKIDGVRFNGYVSEHNIL